MSWPFSTQLTEPEADWTWPGSTTPSISASSAYLLPPSSGGFDGEKFYGGVARFVDELDSLDYWTLRDRSSRLFRTNTYARGIIRRLVTNIINTGLVLEATPEEALLGLEEDSLVDWAENIENLFALWGRTPRVCDAKGYRSFGALQRDIYREALIEGDCLVISRQDPMTKLPQLQIVSGRRVRRPFLIEEGRTVVDGVHIDANGRHLGYYVYKGTEDVYSNEFEYIPAYGALTGRLQAWMVYGFDKREDGVRGEPLLGIAIQPLSEIDRHRDAAQRKAYIDSVIVGHISREKGPATMPLSGGAVRLDQVSLDPTGEAKPLNIAQVLPGIFMERLQPGEKPESFSGSGAEVNFGAFESTIMVGLAWALEIPPTILFLGFTKNYSASQGEVKEFKMLLDREQLRFGEENNDHVYDDWFMSSLLLGKIEARGYLESLSNPMAYDIRQAWTSSGWSGVVKPSIDLLKVAKGYEVLVKHGWMTNERVARDLGSKLSKNLRRLRKENPLIAEINKPFAVEADPADLAQPGDKKKESKLKLLKGDPDDVADATIGD